jgi:hypothetical protein
MASKVLLKKDREQIISRLTKLCHELDKEVNDHLGYCQITQIDKPYDENIDFGPFTRDYMSLKFNFGVDISQDGFFKLMVDIEPRGVLINNKDRYLPEKIRNNKCQIDPCSYLHKNQIYYTYNEFLASPGCTYAVKRFNEYGKEIMGNVNKAYKSKVCYINGSRVHCEDKVTYQPEQCIAYCKQQAKGPIKYNDQYYKEFARQHCNIKNFSLDMKEPEIKEDRKLHERLTKQLLSDVTKYHESKRKEKEEASNQTIRQIMKKYRKNPFQKIGGFFKDKFISISNHFTRKKENKKESNKFILNNNFISVILMVLPPIIYIVNTILVLILGKNFEISLSSDVLWVSHAFAYKLCDIINVAISESANVFVTILLWIAIVLSGILETILSLIHVILFAIIYFPIYTIISTL